MFTVKRDIRFFRPFTEWIWRHGLYVGVSRWAKSSAVTESMSEQCTGWHHPINHLSALQMLQSILLTAYLQKNTGRGRHHKSVVFRATWSWCTDLLAPAADCLHFLLPWLSTSVSQVGAVLYYVQDQFCHQVLFSQNPTLFNNPQSLYLLFSYLLCSLPSFFRAQLLTPLTSRETPTAKTTAMEDTLWHESGTSPELKHLIVNNLLLCKSTVILNKFTCEWFNPQLDKRYIY